LCRCTKTNHQTFLISPATFLVALTVVLLVHYWRVALPMLAGMIALVAIIKMLVPDPVH
jgi:hypothetical protein